MIIKKTTTIIKKTKQTTMTNKEKMNACQYYKKIFLKGFNYVI
jgi:hypothetical protein